jgi:hypothetical protein
MGFLLQREKEIKDTCLKINLIDTQIKYKNWWLSWDQNILTVLGTGLIGHEVYISCTQYST